MQAALRRHAGSESPTVMLLALSTLQTHNLLAEGGKPSRRQLSFFLDPGGPDSPMNSTITKDRPGWTWTPPACRGDRAARLSSVSPAADSTHPGLQGLVFSCPRIVYGIADGPASVDSETGEFTEVIRDEPGRPTARRSAWVHYWPERFPSQHN